MNSPNILTKIGILRGKIEYGLPFEALVTLKDIEREIKNNEQGE